MTCQNKSPGRNCLRVSRGAVDHDAEESKRGLGRSRSPIDSLTVIGNFEMGVEHADNDVEPLEGTQSHSFVI